MKRKGVTPLKYRIDITWSTEDRAYVARVPELPGCVSDGKTVEEAAANAQEAIAVYVETLADLGKPLPAALADRDFSGKIPLRISADLHRDLTAQAMIEDLSLNQFIERKLKKA